MNNASSPKQEEFALPSPPPPAPPKKKSRWRLIWLTLFVLILVPSLGAYAVLSPLPLTANKTIVIPRGASLHDIALKLQYESIAPNRLIFRAVTRAIAKEGLKAGEYEFSPNQSLVDAVAMMRDGRSVIRLLTIPEGLTSAEVVNLLDGNPVLTGAVTATPPEGSLLPESYRYSYGDSRQSIIERMQKDQRVLLDELWPKREDGLPLQTPQEAVIMASIIERETGKMAEERPRVAGVFYNRLRKSMRLQSDPTVIYALTNGKNPLGRELTRKDLAVDSAYNTYIKDGLPPGPINNPGRASLEAALHPEKHDFLYFVADGTGGHAFAKNLNEHNKNVNHWHKLPKP